MRGLIASVLGRASGTYGDIAKSNFDRQQELNYQKEISKMAEEKELRVDEIRRKRNIADIGGVATATVAAERATLPDRLAMARTTRENEVETEGLVAENLGAAQRTQAEAARTDFDIAEEERRAMAETRAAEHNTRLQDEAYRAKYEQDRKEAADALVDSLASFQGSADERRNLERQIRVLQTGATGDEDPMTTAVGILQASSVLSRQAADADAGGDFEGAVAIRERANALSSMATDLIFGNQANNSIPVEAFDDLMSNPTEERIKEFEEFFGTRVPRELFQQQAAPAPAVTSAEPAITPEAADLVANRARERAAQPRPYYAMPTEDQAAEMTAWNLSKELVRDLDKLEQAEARPNMAVTPAERASFIEQLKSSILEKQTRLAELGI